MLLGHLVAKFLTAPPSQPFWTELGLTEAQANDALEEGLKLWSKVLKIAEILQQREDSEGQVSSAG